MYPMLCIIVFIVFIFNFKLKHPVGCFKCTKLKYSSFFFFGIGSLSRNVAHYHIQPNKHSTTCHWWAIFLHSNSFVWLWAPETSICWPMQDLAVFLFFRFSSSTIFSSNVFGFDPLVGIINIINNFIKILIEDETHCDRWTINNH